MIRRAVRAATCHEVGALGTGLLPGPRGSTGRSHGG